MIGEGSSRQAPTAFDEHELEPILCSRHGRSRQRPPGTAGPVPGAPVRGLRRRPSTPCPGTHDVRTGIARHRNLFQPLRSGAPLQRTPGHALRSRRSTPSCASWCNRRSPPGRWQTCAGPVTELADRLIGDVLAGGSEFDLHDDFAFPLPVIVIAGMLGVPAADLDRFKHWSDIQVAAMGAEDPTRICRRSGRLLCLHAEPPRHAVAQRSARAKKCRMT